MLERSKWHPSVTDERILALTEAYRTSLDNPGICLTCGAEAEGVEPDAERYDCEGCGAPMVYGAEQLLLYIAA